MKVLQLPCGGMLSSPQSETQRTGSDPVKPKGLSLYTTCKTVLCGFPGDSHNYLRKYRELVFPDSVVHRHCCGHSDVPTAARKSSKVFVVCGHSSGRATQTSLTHHPKSDPGAPCFLLEISASLGAVADLQPR